MTFLSPEFAARRVRKSYLAVVSGSLPEEDHGRIDVPLLKTGRSVAPGRLEDGADAARTDWRILKRNEEAALIEARPKTGRMHQIRAHLAHLGCPILGDVIYGTGTESAPRLMLHAAGLQITRPDGQELTLDAPAPEVFIDMQSQLGL